MKFKKLLLTVGFFALSATASATTIVGSALQDQLDAMTDGDFYNVNTEQYNPDEVWQLGSTGGSFNRLLFEMAGFANIANFGIYDINNISNTLEIFNGSDCGGASGGCSTPDAFSILTLGSGNTFSVYNSNGGMTASAIFNSINFGYYLDSGDGIFYSQAGENGGDDHMVAFRGDDNLQFSRKNDGNYATFLDSEYIFAWEDLQLSNSDKDYTDFVVMVESVSSVPAPNALAAMGLGLFGLAVSRRRKTKATK